MKLPLLVFLSTVACAMAQGESAAAPELKFADLGDFKLESGAATVATLSLAVTKP